jgi:hypothetical protein
MGDRAKSGDSALRSLVGTKVSELSSLTVLLLLPRSNFLIEEKSEKLTLFLPPDDAEGELEGESETKPAAGDIKA